MLSIKNVTKYYGDFLAVDNLSFEINEGEIFGLLGVNGAGKTTTISMITGLFPPTSGTAIVNGYDIRYDIESLRNTLGLCPQHNVLFDELTVAEHIRFFSKLKGLREEQIIAEIDKYLKLLELFFSLLKENRVRVNDNIMRSVREGD